VCAAVVAQAHSHHRKECCTVWATSPADGNGHPPMAQLMPTKVILTLLLSCLVFVAHKHAMVQVHSWVRGHGDKAPRLPQQEAASEVNACPCHHALIAVCMFAGLISSSSAWLPSRDWCLERATRDHRRSPMSPPDASIVVSLAYYATHDSALHRNWSTGGPWPSFRHREPPSRTPRTLGAAMRMVAQRPAMVHRVGRAVLLDVKCPLDGCP
jgi:hypothetical protein